MVKDFTRKKCKGGKLYPKWIGPYTIQKKLSRGVYTVALHDDLLKTRKMTGAHLKLYKKPSKFGKLKIHYLISFLLTVKDNASHNSSFSVESECSLDNYVNYSENDYSGDGDPEYSNDDLSSDGYHYHSDDLSKYSKVTIITIVTLTTQMKIIAVQIVTITTQMMALTLMTIIPFR